MVLALLWVCVSNMHSIILVEGLGAKMDLLGFRISGTVLNGGTGLRVFL
jgi:hypothetical protein